MNTYTCGMRLACGGHKSPFAGKQQIGWFLKCLRRMVWLRSLAQSQFKGKLYLPPQKVDHPNEQTPNG